MGTEEVAERFSVSINDFNTLLEVTCVLLHADSVYVVVRIFVMSSQVRRERGIMATVWVKNKAGEASLGSDMVTVFPTYLPPITFALPLKIFDRLVTTISA